jgi:hypothetical protein
MGWIKKTITALKWMELAKFVFDLLVAIGSLKLAKKVLSYIPQISPDWATIIAWFVAAGVLFFLIWRQERQLRSYQQVMSNASTALTNIPSPKMATKDFFRLAYYSPLQSEVEANLRKAAIEAQPNDVAGYYLKLLAVGIIAYGYDQLWWLIFKSQLLALLELNRNAGLLPLDKIKKFYDDAVAKSPKQYANCSFDEWFNYLTSNTLLFRHPSDMVEITVRGKDFLKYLLHWGREPELRRL